MTRVSHSFSRDDFEGFCNTLTENCIASERTRGLSHRSLKELEHILSRFNTYLCKQRITDFTTISSETIRDFLYFANPNNSPALGKAHVWCMRKFFSFLALHQIIIRDPAKSIPHPKARPREKLPDYLKAEELHALLGTAAMKRSVQDFTVLSILATAGPRPHEIAKLRPQDISIGQQYILLHVKGGWYKRTPISAEMAQILQEYLDTYSPKGSALFLNQWKRPIDRRWVERLVRSAARQAGIRKTVTPNTLRHTFATYAADRHGPVITRALLGHCGRSHSTDVYMHLVPGKFRALMNAHPYQTTIRTKRRSG